MGLKTEIDVTGKLANQVIDWIKADADRYQTLQIAADLNLNQWCLGAGFVRNLVWDHLHFNRSISPLNDIDFIYFNEEEKSAELDLVYEERVNAISSKPWSVKNQARMHQRNNDSPYQSTLDAMSYWTEIETAVGVTMKNTGELELLTPFGIKKLFDKTISFNPKSNNPVDFAKRVSNKQWLRQWPDLKLVASHLTLNR